MTSFVYNSARTNFASGAFNWVTLPVNAMLANANYSASPSDLYVSSILPGAIVVRDLALTNLAQVNQVLSGIIPLVQALIGPVPVLALVLYAKRATDAVSELLYYSSDGVGFPFTPQGFDYGVGYNQLFGGFIGTAPSRYPALNSFTSQIYPIVVVEHFSSIGALPPQPHFQYNENVQSSAAITGGTLSLSLIVYSNWPAENFQSSGAITAGTLILGLMTYSNWPAENISSSGAIAGGTLILGLVTYGNWPAENIQASGAITGGTLT